MRAEARGVSKRFGDRVAVRDLDLEVDDGQVVGLLGSNGAGKTTTARMVLGLLEPDAGSVSFLGVEGDARRHTGYAPQETGLHMSLDGRQNIRYWGGVFGLTPTEADAAAAPLAERLDLARLLGQRVASLSLGEQRKLQLVTALIHRPGLLVLDEATAFLDVTARREVMAILDEVVAEGTAILYSTHVLHEAEELCRQVVVLDRGVTVYAGATADLVARHGVVRVVVQHEGPGDDVLADLAGRFPSARLSEDEVAVECPDGRPAEQLLAEVAAGLEAHSAVVMGLRIQRPGLESALISLLDDPDPAIRGESS